LPDEFDDIGGEPQLVVIASNVLDHCTPAHGA
jgi:hypothetical protein